MYYFLWLHVVICMQCTRTINCMKLNCGFSFFFFVFTCLINFIIIFITKHVRYLTNLQKTIPQKNVNYLKILIIRILIRQCWLYQKTYLKTFQKDISKDTLLRVFSLNFWWGWGPNFFLSPPVPVRMKSDGGTS